MPANKTTHSKLMIDADNELTSFKGFLTELGHYQMSDLLAALIADSKLGYYSPSARLLRDFETYKEISA